MTNRVQHMILPPFPPGYRASGILLHVTSLPSPYGIGDMGPAAFRWIDRPYDAGQSWWQALPLGPTGYGDSPYQALSSFAGNGLLISPELLLEDGLLDASACKAQLFPPNYVDYGATMRFKHRLLNRAWRNFGASAGKKQRSAYEEFCQAQSYWLEDYALFRALKEKYAGSPYCAWPTELVHRDPVAMDRARNELSEQTDKIRFAQFLIFRQARNLKEYAHARRVGLIGDLPFFVSPDSSDVWAHPELFLLNEESRPRFVAGVPPDYFSADGQLWGNPVYDWNALGRTGFRFCIDRLRLLLSYVDVIRLDHFRAFVAAWHLPAEARTARTGHWVPGPGAEFFHAVQKELGSLPFIAEDLGLITPDVSALRDEFHIPGTRVLQFAFDGNSDNPHLPEKYIENTVVYTGTHDNNTTRGWFEGLPETEQKHVWRYLSRTNRDSREIAGELVQVAWSSVATVAIAPLQDLLNLGSEARMNTPGSAAANWCWRATEDLLKASVFEQLGDLTTASNRTRVAEVPRITNAVEASL